MKTILVCGSKALSGDVAAKRSLAQILGREVAGVPAYRLLTGGAIGEGDGKTTGGVDFMVAMGASEVLGPDLLPQRLLTVLPRDCPPNRLFQAGTILLARGKTTPARRFELVARADAVITLEGSEGTPAIIEYAIAAGRPVVPVACSGGASESAWLTERYRRELLESLRLVPGDRELEVLEHGLGTPSLVVDTCMAILRNVLRPRCFVLMPFGSAHSDALYSQVLVKVLDEEGWEPLRADRLQGTRPIMDDIESQIEQADLVLADLTGSNPNVMYELGLAHAKGKRVVITCKKEKNERLEDLIPFDLRAFRILPFTFFDRDTFESELKLWLRAMKEP